MVCVLRGRLEWSMTRDAEGHREYKISHLVEGETTDGPAAALLTFGLPIPGSSWSQDGDVDLWAFCLPNADVKATYKKGEPGRFWEVSQTYSTKNRKRCSEEKIEDPLAEPPKVTGGFQTRKEEATTDIFNLPIETSSHEMLRGAQVEFPISTPTVSIEQNVASFYQAFTLPAISVNCVNNHWLWGLPPRTVLLASTSWDKKYYGTCNSYYSRKLEFHIKHDFHDRRLLDEGTKVLNGHWDRTTGRWVLDNIAGEAPDPDNPQHFIQFKDKNGENCRVVLDGYGKPSGASTGDSSQYIQVGDGTAGELLPSNTSYWIAQVGGDDVWAATEACVVGHLRVYDSILYICKLANTGSQPDTSPIAWLALPTDVTDNGVWDAATTYTLGDRVTNPNADERSAAGEVYVAKYPGTNFLLLGIPLSF